MSSIKEREVEQNNNKPSAPTITNQKVEVINIHPRYATNLLSKNGNIRKLDPKHVKSLYNEMAKGNWQISNDAIVVDENGQLKNGQHRLTALVEYGQPLPFLVLYDSEVGADRIMDSGNKRSHQDVISKYTNKNLRRIVTTTKGFIYSLKDYRRFKNELVFTNSEFEDYFLNNQATLEYMAMFIPPVEDLMSLLVFGYFSEKVLSKYDRSVYVRFLNDFLYGYKEYGAKQNAAVLLYNQIVSSRSSKEYYRNDILAAMMLKTFNIWIKEEPIPNLIRWSAVESYPEL